MSGQYLYYKVRTKHAWGYGDWETHEHHLGDTESWADAEKEIAGEIHDKHEWSDKYRGVEIERLDVPPKEWVAQQLAGEKRSILWARERIHRLKRLQRRLPILGYDKDGTELWAGRIPIDQRPHVGETWKNIVGEEVQITGVDPYGRSFSYQRSRDQWQDDKLVPVVVNGEIGQTEVLDGKAVKVKP